MADTPTKAETVVEYRLGVIEGTVGKLDKKLDDFLDKFVTQAQLRSEVDHLDERHNTATAAVAADVEALKADVKAQNDRTLVLEDAKRERRSTWAIFWAGTAVTLFGGGVVAVIYELITAASHLTGSTH